MTGALLVWLALAAAPPQPSELLPRSGGAVLGQEAPWFAAWTADQQVVNRTNLLEALRTGHRRGFALVFFATWCAPCEEGLRAMAGARERLEKAGLRLVLVNWREPADQVQPWLHRRGLGDAALLLDRFGRVAGAFGVEDAGKATLPRTVVVDAAGRVRLIVGREGPDYVDRLLEALTGGTPAAPAVVEHP